MAKHYTSANGWEEDESGQLREVPHHVVKVYRADTDAGREQVEQVARALFCAGNRPILWQDMPEHSKAEWRHDARAVLDTLRGDDQ